MKTAIGRKNQTERILTELKIPFNSHLPILKEEEETEIRKAKEIAHRILILTYLNYSGEVEEDKPSVVEFLKKQNIWNSATPVEKKQFLSKEKFDPQELTNFSWKSECIWTLLWSIKKVGILELPIIEIELLDFVDVLPNFMDSPKKFIETSELRDKSIILDKSDLLYRLDWAVKNDESKKLFINSSMVQERRYAINWITCYKNLEWDDIPIDT